MQLIIILWKSYYDILQYQFDESVRDDGEFNCSVVQWVNKEKLHWRRECVCHVCWSGIWDPNLFIFVIVVVAQSREPLLILSPDTCFLLETVTIKLDFLSFNSATANSEKILGLIKLFQRDYLRVSLIRCFSHPQKIEMKDTLKDLLELVDASLHHKYYMYISSCQRNSTKKPF